MFLVLLSCRGTHEPPGSALASYDRYLLGTESWSALGTQEGALLGRDVVGGQDVNADGYADVLIGSFNDYDGAVDLYLGSNVGLATTPAVTLRGADPPNRFADGMAFAGDVNGDGYADVVVGDPTADNGGAAYLYFGSPTGLLPIPEWSASSDDDPANFGSSVASAGDVNGDGFDDLIVGATTYGDGGAAFVYLGGPDVPSTAPDWFAESDVAGTSFGVAVAGVGDVDLDGYDDIVVGADYYGPGSEGAVFLYRGAEKGPSATYDWMRLGSGETARMGASVAGAGDVNGDGHADAIFGEFSYSAVGAAGVSVGRAVLHLGSDTGLGDSEAWSVDGTQKYANLGTAVASAGDVDGDGLGDVLIGAPGYSGAVYLQEGQAYLYLGTKGGLRFDPVWTHGSSAFFSNYGSAVAGAGDVNGDGYDDILVGASEYGDVTHDGGRAYLYQGGCYDEADTDGDGIGDACDACPGYNDVQYDTDGDGACAIQVTGASLDCDDDDPTSYPGGLERCDGRDNGCTGGVPPDELDSDGDHVIKCAECDDTDPSSYPGAPQLCDGIDNSCAGQVPSDEVDADGDGALACEDCDDADMTSFPGAPQICDGRDNPCIGALPPEEVDGDDDGALACADCDDPSTQLPPCVVLPKHCGCSTDGAGAVTAWGALLATVYRRRRGARCPRSTNRR